MVSIPPPILKWLEANAPYCTTLTLYGGRVEIETLRGSDTVIDQILSTLRHEHLTDPKSRYRFVIYTADQEVKRRSFALPRSPETEPMGERPHQDEIESFVVSHWAKMVDVTVAGYKDLLTSQQAVIDRYATGEENRLEIMAHAARVNVDGQVRLRELETEQMKTIQDGDRMDKVVEKGLSYAGALLTSKASQSRDSNGQGSGNGNGVSPVAAIAMKDFLEGLTPEQRKSINVALDPTQKQLFQQGETLLKAGDEKCGVILGIMMTSLRDKQKQRIIGVLQGAQQEMFVRMAEHLGA